MLPFSWLFLHLTYEFLQVSFFAVDRTKKNSKIKDRKPKIDS